MHQTMTMTIRQQNPPSGTIGLCESVVDRVYNWEEGNVPKIPCQETILDKEGLNEINMNSYCNILILWRQQMAQHQGGNPRKGFLVKAANLYIREKYSQFLTNCRPVHLVFTLVSPRFSHCPCLHGGQGSHRFQRG